MEPLHSKPKRVFSPIQIEKRRERARAFKKGYQAQWSKGRVEKDGRIYGRSYLELMRERYPKAKLDIESETNEE